MVAYKLEKRFFDIKIRNNKTNKIIKKGMKLRVKSQKSI